MKIKIQIFLLLVYIVVTANECKKNKPPVTDDGLPLATQTGANIFACRVNGINWIAKNSINNRGGGVVGDTLYVWGANPSSTNFYERFDLQVNRYLQGINSYQLSDTIDRFARFSTDNNCFAVSGGGIGRGKSFDGELKLSKVDLVNKIISGTFWFNIKTDYCDTLKVTDGRFDIKYY